MADQEYAVIPGAWTLDQLCVTLFHMPMMGRRTTVMPSAWTLVQLEITLFLKPMMDIVATVIPGAWTHVHLEIAPFLMQMMGGGNHCDAWCPDACPTTISPHFQAKFRKGGIMVKPPH
jgi:hypothetical protein